MGVVISSAVIPITLTLLWSKQNRMAATIAPIFGFAAAIITWLTTTYGLYGEITVDTTNQNMPMMAGNLVALFSPVLVTVPLSLWKPDNFTFDATRNIEIVTDETVPEEQPAAIQKQEEVEAEQVQMRKSARFAKYTSVILALCLFVLWPLPMFGSQYVFSLPFFRGWVIVSIIWVFCSTFAVGLFPLWEARKDAVIVVRAIWQDLRGRRQLTDLPKVTVQGITSVPENADGVVFEDKKI